MRSGESRKGAGGSVLAGAVNVESIIEVIRGHQPVSVEALAVLLSSVFSTSLTDAQRIACIQGHLRHLVDVGQVRNKGSRRYPLWGLVDGRE